MKAKHQNFLTLKGLECPHFLNMPTQISLNTLKLHNERVDELFKKVEDNFKWNPVHPKESIESIMYRAGQASVVQYIKTIIEEEK
tara:strand:- start:1148 stop:1402 length:255 start_codon:yes stop_codon:yes gene_type:complete